MRGSVHRPPLELEHLSVQPLQIVLSLLESTLCHHVRELFCNRLATCWTPAARTTTNLLAIRARTSRLRVTIDESIDARDHLRRRARSIWVAGLSVTCRHWLWLDWFLVWCHTGRACGRCRRFGIGVVVAILSTFWCLRWISSRRGRRLLWGAIVPRLDG